MGKPMMQKYPAEFQGGKRMPASRRRGILTKGSGVLRATAAGKYAWRQPQHAELPGRGGCRMRPVSRRGNDEWRHRSPSPQVAAEQPWPAKVPHYWAPGRGTSAPVGSSRA